MRICLRRREFIAGLGGALGWALAARAQQRPIWLSTRSAAGVFYTLYGDPDIKLKPILTDQPDLRVRRSMSSRQTEHAASSPD
jgi:hypothetical protein